MRHLSAFVPRDPALPNRQCWIPPCEHRYWRRDQEWTPQIPVVSRYSPGDRGYDGYGSLVEGEAVKGWNWGAFAVGLGAFGATFALGVVGGAVIREPHMKHIVPIALLPSLGAGIIAYLLRANKDSAVCAAAAGPVALVEVEQPQEQASGTVQRRETIF